MNFTFMGIQVWICGNCGKPMGEHPKYYLIPSWEWACDLCFVALKNTFTVVPYIYGNAGCDHTWSQYVGFLETYEYCVKCDEKR